MMMGAPGAMMGLERLDLSTEQRQRIAQIQDEARQQHQAWAQAMHAPGGPMAGAMAGDPLDEAATRRAYESMSQMHKAMFESHLQTRQRILAVLTPEQRTQLGRAWGGGRPGS
jgi:Spy/CpxP family protein refolding chaperone